MRRNGETISKDAVNFFFIFEYATKFDYFRDDLDRRLQAKALAELCAKSENPVVFLGYVTSRPGSRDYQKLVDDGRMKDIDSTDKSRFCEYIFYRDLVK